MWHCASAFNRDWERLLVTTVMVALSFIPPCFFWEIQLVRFQKYKYLEILSIFLWQCFQYFWCSMERVFQRDWETGVNRDGCSFVFSTFYLLTPVECWQYFYSISLWQYFFTFSALWQSQYLQYIFCELTSRNVVGLIIWTVGPNIPIIPDKLSGPARPITLIRSKMEL